MAITRARGARPGALGSAPGRVEAGAVVVWFKQPPKLVEHVAIYRQVTLWVDEA
jgi:hypothetical protein